MASVAPPAFFVSAAILRVVDTPGHTSAGAAARIQLAGAVLWAAAVVVHTFGRWAVPAAARVLAGVLFFGAALVVLLDAPGAVIVAVAALQLAGSLIWVLSATATTSPRRAAAALVLAGLLFLASSVTFVATSSRPVDAWAGWLQTAGASVWIVASEPTLRSTQDWWLLSHALFGAVLLTFWAAVLRDDDVYWYGSWAFTLVAALVWELAEDFLEKVAKLASETGTCAGLGACMLPPENAVSWILDVLVAIFVHLLLQLSPATRQAVRPDTGRYAPLGAAVGVWCAVMIATRCFCPRNRQDSDAARWASEKLMSF